MMYKKIVSKMNNRNEPICEKAVADTVLDTDI